MASGMFARSASTKGSPMNKVLLAAAAAIASVAAASGAQAAQFITITGPSGTFGDDTVACPAGATAPCGFSRSFQFATPSGFNLTSATISSVISGTSQITNLDFSSVTLNGVQFTNIISDGAEFRTLLNQPLAAGGLNTILVNGTTGGEASFAGTLSFSAIAAAVPEPSTWALMILGFGAVGYSMRRRNAGVRFAHAI